MTAEIELMEERRWQAMIDKDIDVLNALLHAQMRYTHSNASVDTKDSYITAIKNKVFDYRNVETKDTEIQLIGENDLGLVNGQALISVLAGGRELTLDCRYTCLWKHTDNGWQFLAWHNTPLPK
ncbi:MAG: nuclear transport factor 2 family protein [Actinomycetota bacterium]|nr:nuclear transport factor 2 family protein [Actinomycetota bacterium]